MSFSHYEGQLHDEYADDLSISQPSDYEPDVCPHCGKEFEDFSDIGCGYCDRRSPEWGDFAVSRESAISELHLWEAM